MISEITSKMRLEKSVDKVFDALVDPEKIGNYWFSSSSQKVEEGKRIIWIYKEYNAEVPIHVVKVEENRRIVYTWGEGEEKTTVTFLLKKDKGSTILEVTESGFNLNNPEIVNILLGQKEGWMYMLTCLKGYLENGISTLRGSLIH
ncbi:SRPBCC family protein [Bacillus sp. JJ1521]|uniref:SRPBCC family protein n=1 Tax=Bacillus sp. JJ1521 TaxID=3122957 RepID=UPI0030007C7D